MNTERMIIGFVILSVTSIAFYMAFGSEQKSYIPQSDIENLGNLGKQYVGEAKPSFFSQLYFFVSSFWTIIKASFNFATVGMTNLIFDVASGLGFPVTLVTMIIGVIIFVVAIDYLNDLRGGKKR